jgi:cytoskeleton protein RodZ
LPSFGEKLKQERLKRSVTLEQISLSTKIGTRMLQALEEEKFNQLPGGIFNKGFVRAYARHLGLDEDQTVADYLTASGEVAPEPIPEIMAEAARQERRPPAPSRPLPWGLFAALLLLVALVLSIWSRRQHKPEERAGSAPAATQPTSSQPTAAPMESPPPASAQHETKMAAPASAPVSSQPSALAASVSSPSSAGSSPGSARPLAEPVPASVGSQADQFTVVILAREDSWLSITADGKTTFTETLLAGDQRAVRARDKVVLKCGNTGALEFVFNGRKLPSQGGKGEVRTLTFGAGGLEPAVVAPPAEQ